VLGFAIATQVRSTKHRRGAGQRAARRTWCGSSPTLDSRAERLRREIAELEESKLAARIGRAGPGGGGGRGAPAAEVLGILAGTLPAEGPGSRSCSRHADQRIRADSVLDAVEELRGAGPRRCRSPGASGDPVRIVAASYFVDSG
jgi:hypothetical protein